MWRLSRYSGQTSLLGTIVFHFPVILQEVGINNSHDVTIWLEQIGFDGLAGWMGDRLLKKVIFSSPSLHLLFRYTHPLHAICTYALLHLRTSVMLRLQCDKPLILFGSAGKSSPASHTDDGRTEGSQPAPHTLHGRWMACLKSSRPRRL